MNYKLTDINPGDILIREMRGEGRLRTPVTVKEIRGAVVLVTLTPTEFVRANENALGKDLFLLPFDLECPPVWTFSMETGGEIDLDLGWDGIYTGSYLIKPKSMTYKPITSGIYLHYKNPKTNEWDIMPFELLPEDEQKRFIEELTDTGVQRLTEQLSKIITEILDALGLDNSITDYEQMQPRTYYVDKALELARLYIQIIDGYNKMRLEENGKEE